MPPEGESHLVARRKEAAVLGGQIRCGLEQGAHGLSLGTARLTTLHPWQDSALSGSFGWHGDDEF